MGLGAEAVISEGGGHGRENQDTRGWGWGSLQSPAHPAIAFHNEGVLKSPQSRLMESLQQVTCASQCVETPHFISDFYWPDTGRGVSPVLTGRSGEGKKEKKKSDEC